MMFVQKKYIISKSVVFWIGVLVFLFVNEAKAADLVAFSPVLEYEVGDTFTVDVRIVPNGDEVRIVESVLAFDPTFLTVVDITRGPTFSVWTVGPEVSNENGTIRFAGSDLNTIDQTANILSATFEVNNEGETSLEFSDTKILSTVYSNTNLYDAGLGTTYSLTSFSDEQVATPNSSRLGIVSNEYSDPEKWYNLTSGTFSWELPVGVDAVAAEVTLDSDNRPQTNSGTVFVPPIDSFAVNTGDLSEGVQFFSLNFRNEDGWGIAENRLLKIDTVPPDDFLINIETNRSPRSFPTLSFEAFDSTSGIDYYELVLGNRQAVRILAAEIAEGYRFSNLEDGNYSISVTAFDQAGNQTISTSSVNITAGWTGQNSEGSKSMESTIVGVMILLLILITALFSIFIWNKNRTWRKQELELHDQIEEIQDQMHKIFGALRDEIHDQVISITARKSVSAKEKEVIKKLVQTLEVGETLIGKEIDDVRSILKR